MNRDLKVGATVKILQGVGEGGLGIVTARTSRWVWVVLIDGPTRSHRMYLEGYLEVMYG